MNEYVGDDTCSKCEIGMRQLLDPFIDSEHNTYNYNDKMRKVLLEYTGIDDWPVCYDDNYKIHTSDALIYYICWTMDCCKKK